MPHAVYTIILLLAATIATADILARLALTDPSAGPLVQSLRTLRIHDLRHSFASFAVASGLPLYLIGKTLGHAEARTTERYAHILEDPVRDASETVATSIRAILKK